MTRWLWLLGLACTGSDVGRGPDDSGEPSDSGADTGGGPVDGDQDGYLAGSEDCDDQDAEINPGEFEVPGNGTDEDCDGSDAGPTRELDDALAIWDGETWSMSGWELADAGDVDADGVPDLLVAAPWDAFDGPGEGYQSPGAYYLVSLDQGSSEAMPATATILPVELEVGTGWSQAGGGDLNGDGFDDIAVAMPDSVTPSGNHSGRVLVYLGPIQGNLAEVDADADVQSTGTDAYFGAGLAFLTGESKDIQSLAVSAPLDGADRSGEIYVWNSIPPGLVVDTTADLTILGSMGYASAGVSMIGWVDMNSDGMGDLVISEQSLSTEVAQAGAVHVLPGPVTDATSLGTDSIVLWGDGENSNAGRRLLVMDADDDGHVDLWVTAPLDPEVATRGGKVWLIPGPITTGGHLDDLARASILPESGYEWLGQQLVSPGDLDGDALPDLAVSAPRDFYYGGDLPGKVYLFHGNLAGTVSGADADLVLQGERFGDFAGGGLAAGFDVDQDGLGDLAVGAPMYDGAGNGSGRVYIMTGLTW